MLTEEEKAKRWSSGVGYNRYITSELNSFRKDAWKDTMLKHFGTKQNLNILDVGTGPGFFACILAKEGHRVTGIDWSEGMLVCGRNNAAKLSIKPHFRQMNINDLQFADESFDAIVTRNVTWTLDYPEKVYAEFKRILKPSGILLIYDANWHRHYFDEEMMKRVRKREQRYFEKYGKKEVVCGDDTEYFMPLPLSGIYRPDWDEKVLARLGFDVKIEEDLGRKVYEEWEMDLYGEFPLFEICAVKKPMDEDTRKVHNYWQKRSASFGFDVSERKVLEWRNRISSYLPTRKLKVLDVGTGTGFIACITAMLGHDVIGVDLCSNMIKKAIENAESLDLGIDFLCTDAGELPFEDGSFDVIISRNLLWALAAPEETLKQWRRLLKLEGMVVCFDGNHYYYLFNEEDKHNRQLYEKINGSLHGRGDEKDSPMYKEMDDAAVNLPLSKYNRPYEWDNIVLPKLGYKIVKEDIAHPQDKLREGIAEGYYTNFAIAAKKTKG
jgi:ubiquinone/menaquinone biosynthesis C-methylase UbiE